MTEPLARPGRKNPVLKTRAPTLPPGSRSRVALGLTAAAAMGRFELQVCEECEAVQYPPREACHRCLSEKLQWREQDGKGELISETILRHSNDLFFRERLPWRLGMVRLDAGPTVVAHLHGDCDKAPAQVKVSAGLDRAGQGVLMAFPVTETANMADDPQLRELTSNPKFRRALVTDGKTAVGQAITRGLIDAGAEIVWVGYAEPWKRFPGMDELEQLPQVEMVPLDVTDSRGVKQLAGSISAKVDILVNNAEYHRSEGIASRYGVETARAEMDINYFGLLRLAQEFGPVMRARGADGVRSATAWVNLLSIYALSNFPSHGTYSASKAAAFSLAQCLRAEMTPSGVRVVNVFPGPIDDEWNQLMPPPKLAPQAIARAILQALQSGVEDVYPGDVAQDWLARYMDNPKVLEREVGQ
ncbi:MAG: SDR family NAD(P)-dependent oxidoreductase [Burkholderiaceae bacterium]